MLLIKALRYLHLKSEDNMAQRGLRTILAYGLWLLSAAVALLAAAQLRQFLLIDFPIMVLFPLGLSRYAQRAMDRFGTVLIGLAWLIFVVASESYFRKLVDEEMEARRVAKLFLVEALIVIAAFAGSWLV
jgi:hypothetical protein